MKHRIATATAFAFAGIVLAGCPREQAPRNVEPAAEAAPATTTGMAAPASIATPASTQATPQASEPELPQNGHMRAPPPEPDPLIPPPPPPPVEK